MDHGHLVGCLLVTLDFGFDSDSYVHFYHRNFIRPVKMITKNMYIEKKQYSNGILFRSCDCLDSNLHPIPYHDRCAIARYDLGDLILNGGWMVLASNLNLVSLNLSAFLDFLLFDFHLSADKFQIS